MHTHTGPFALFALVAAAMEGVTRVFAIEANPTAAALAREAVAAAEASGQVGGLWVGRWVGR